MTSRERVLAAIEHREPDRVPLDLGGTIMSGIMALALIELRKALGLPRRLVKVYEPYQMLGEVEMDLVEALGVDILPVEPDALFFGLPRRDWKPFNLWDGTQVLVPGRFQVEATAEGGWLIRQGGDPKGAPVGVMPRNGYYFDHVGDQTLHADFTPPPLQDLERRYRALLHEETLAFLVEKAERLRPTGKALLLGIWHDFGPPAVGNVPDWLCLMASDPDYVDRLFAIKTEADLRTLERLWTALGDRIDVFGIDGADFGTQRSEMFSPELFERFYEPYYTRINAWIHAHTPWKTWKHTCGSNRRFLPALVRSGLDCLNPVQTSAAGMDPAELKRVFGARLTFWGGGVDTQRVLPFGTPEEVYDDVRRRLAIFKPGGGYVFNAIHNIQARVPAANLIAMFRALNDHGRYASSAPLSQAGTSHDTR